MCACACDSESLSLTFQLHYTSSDSSECIEPTSVWCDKCHFRFRCMSLRLLSAKHMVFLEHWLRVINSNVDFFSFTSHRWFDFFFQAWFVSLSLFEPKWHNLWTSASWQLMLQRFIFDFEWLPWISFFYFQFWVISVDFSFLFSILNNSRRFLISIFDFKWFLILLSSDRCHRPRDSLLSWSSDFHNYTGSYWKMKNSFFLFEFNRRMLAAASSLCYQAAFVVDLFLT